MDTHFQPCRPWHSREKYKRNSERKKKGERISLAYYTFSYPTHPFYSSTNDDCLVHVVVVPCYCSRFNRLVPMVGSSWFRVIDDPIPIPICCIGGFQSLITQETWVLIYLFLLWLPLFSGNGLVVHLLSVYVKICLVSIVYCQQICI